MKQTFVNWTFLKNLLSTVFGVAKCAKKWEKSEHAENVKIPSLLNDHLHIALSNKIFKKRMPYYESALSDTFWWQRTRVLGLTKPIALIRESELRSWDIVKIYHTSSKAVRLSEKLPNNYGFWGQNYSYTEYFILTEQEVSMGKRCLDFFPAASMLTKKIFERRFFIPRVDCMVIASFSI